MKVQIIRSKGKIIGALFGKKLNAHIDFAIAFPIEVTELEVPEELLKSIEFHRSGDYSVHNFFRRKSKLTEGI